MVGKPLLEVSGLTVAYPGADSPALDDVSFSVGAGERLAVVGESGSGKSTLVKAILGMLPSPARISGSIRFEGVELTTASAKEYTELRGTAIALIPQDPLAALDPLRRVSEQVAEGPIEHGLVVRRRSSGLVDRLLRSAGLPNPEVTAKRYPHQLSGGLRQRVLIANGIASGPRLLLADEPTSSLDVTVQRKVLDSLDESARETGASLFLVTHDLGVARERADRIVVMRRGRILEEGASNRVIESPATEYTRALVDAVPSVKGPSLVDRIEAAAERGAPLLSVRGLSRSYATRTAIGRREHHRALESISFDLFRGETLALVGESGSGKTTTANIVLGLDTPDAGSIKLDGIDILGFRSRAARAGRRRIQPVFQDPSSSLDSRFTVERAIAEPLVVNRIGDRASRRVRAAELARQVALPAELLERRVTELSGGQKQRVAIARALSLEPEILVCDEPVSSLDVLVQEQILELFVDLQRRLGVSYLFITHDLGVVRRIAHRVMVLREGAVVEEGDADDVLSSPTSDYGRELLAAVPSIA